MKQREGVLVKPRTRLSKKQIGLVDEVSRELLMEPGLLCYNNASTELFREAGAKIEPADGCVRVRLNSEIVDRALASCPSTVVLGARNPDNRLVLDAQEPRVRFGSGSETNFWLEAELDGPAPRFSKRPGSIDLLGRAAHLADNLEHLDFFIRCVNIQDPGVTVRNKDVNKYFVSLNNITKHVQAGLTDIDALDETIALGRIIAGGEEAFELNPVLSFIACVIKSPLQVVDDTAEKLIAIARKRVPVVVSSCPMAGATGPFDEFGIVAQINAELLAGVTIVQLASPGAPVLYGSVPVRTRLDNLNDMYGAPEFNHYNIDCAQMARHYKLPCYSTAGVGDADKPGIQATMEKMLTLTSVPWSGAQYIHYAFGLLERTNTFSPEQAVMDNEHIGVIKRMLREAKITARRRKDVTATICEVMETSHKTFMYHLPLPTREDVYVRYPLEDGDGGALHAANRRFNEIMKIPRPRLSSEIMDEVRAKVPGILPEAFEA